MSTEMPTYASVWENLSSIDCSKHVETKNIGGNASLSYLSWAWAWGILMEHYPEAEYEFLPTAYVDNGEGGRTAEVCCVVRIGPLARHMWLPVMGNRNESIVNPTTRQISDARMRCLVKCLALFGLGHKIYAGEDTPDIDAPYNFLLKHNEVLRENLATVLAIRDCLDVDDYSGAFEAWHELTPEEMQTLWRAPSKGGCFDTIHRAKMKSNEWNDARKAMMNLEEV